MAGNHFKTVCSECGTIIEQCRCMDKNKEVRKGVCDTCKKKQQDAKKSDPTTPDKN